MILHRIISAMPSIASLKLFNYDKSLRLIKHRVRSGDFLLEVNILSAEEYEMGGHRIGGKRVLHKTDTVRGEAGQTLKKRSCCIKNIFV